MPKPHHSLNSSSSILSYSVPKLHTGKTWYVDFFCYDPVEQRMRRKKYHLDGIKKLSMRKQRAADLIAALSERLRRGWNVWAENAACDRHYSPYTEVCKFYRRYLDKMFSIGVLKKGSYQSYLSFFGVFNDYLEQYPAKRVVYAYQITLELLSDFLDFMLLDCDVSSRTRNNYRTWLGTFCEWMVEKGYLPENPVVKIKTLPVGEKLRDPLTPQDLRLLRHYLEKHNKHFLLACLLEYYTFIRPEEMTYIRIRDIQIKEQYILLDNPHTKNRKDGAVGVNTGILKLMIELGVFTHCGAEYLFSNREFTPGTTHLDSRAFRETFVKVRTKLGWGPNYQFYSLKDTGIRER